MKTRKEKIAQLNQRLEEVNTLLGYAESTLAIKHLRAEKRRKEKALQKWKSKK